MASCTLATGECSGMEVILLGATMVVLPFAVLICSRRMENNLRRDAMRTASRKRH